MANNYNWDFRCIDNGGKRQFFKAKAASKEKAIEKALKKAKKNASGDINNWECKLCMMF